MDTGKKGVRDDESISSSYTKGCDFDCDSFNFEDDGKTSREPLRVGDMISYYHPLFVAGDRRGYRKTRVTKIEPENEFPLTLLNSECIPRGTTVTRVEIMVDGNLVEHDGVPRSIERFKMERGGHGTACEGVVEDSVQFGKMMGRRFAKLQKKASADGFAPMDVMVNLKGAEAGFEECAYSPTFCHKSEEIGSMGDESSIETPQSEKELTNFVNKSNERTAKLMADVRRQLASDNKQSAHDSSDDVSVLSLGKVHVTIDGMSKVSQCDATVAGIGMFGDCTLYA